MLELSSKKAVSAEMEDLFSLDGKTFQMPKRVSAAITLKYMKMVRTQGQEAALGWAMEKVVGTESYDALMEFEGLEPEDLKQVMTVVKKKLMGAAGDPN